MRVAPDRNSKGIGLMPDTGAAACTLMHEIITKHEDLIRVKAGDFDAELLRHFDLHAWSLLLFLDVLVNELAARIHAGKNLRFWLFVLR